MTCVGIKEGSEADIDSEEKLSSFACLVSPRTLGTTHVCFIFRL